MPEQDAGGFVKTLEEFETHLIEHGWTTSREEVHATDKPLMKQTVTGRQGEFLARAVYTRRKVDGDVDQIDFNYSGAYMESGAERIRWHTFRSQDGLMRFVHEYDTRLLVPSGPLPGEIHGADRCRCSKVRHSSREKAEKALKKARRKRLRNGDNRRLEKRIYPCPYGSGVFHLTSLKEWVDKAEGRDEEREKSGDSPTPGRAGAVRPEDAPDGLDDAAQRGEG